MTIKADLAELERQHKALEHEIAEALAHSSTDDLKIAELKRRKLELKNEIERVRHDHAFVRTRLCGPQRLVCHRYIGTTAVYCEVPDAMMRNAIELI